jgi:hypothetical protein
VQVRRTNSLHRQRGQALIETAVFLPVFLLVLFGVIWTVQSSVIGERSQIAVRFAGLISDEASPYNQYSMGALYNGLPGVAAAETYTCATPPPDALVNNPSNGYFPGPKSPSFFQQSGINTDVCTQGETNLSGGSMSQPLLLVHTQSNIQPYTSVPGYLQSVIGSITQDETASQNFVDGPDIQTVLTCYPDLGNAVEQSLTDATLDVSAAATPLPSSPNTAPLSLSASC